MGKLIKSTKTTQPNAPLQDIFSETLAQMLNRPDIIRPKNYPTNIQEISQEVAEFLPDDLKSPFLAWIDEMLAPPSQETELTNEP